MALCLTDVWPYNCYIKRHPASYEGILEIGVHVIRQTVLYCDEISNVVMGVRRQQPQSVDRYFCGGRLPQPDLKIWNCKGL